MAYLEITGMPLAGAGDQFGLTVSLELEKGRGLSVLSDDGVIPGILADAIEGRRTFSGTIFLNGMRIDPMPARSRSVKVLGDVPGIVPGRTVRENLEIALANRALETGEQIFLIDQELTDGMLAGLGDVRADSLDDTQRTILAATRMLLTRCDLVIIRKLPVPPLTPSQKSASWNPGEQLDALLELKNLLRRHRATWLNLLTDSSCVHLLSDRLVIFSKDKLVQEASLRECLNAPASRLVADFLAFPRMNYRAVRIERDGPFIILRSGRYGFRVSEFLKRQITPREGEMAVFAVTPENLGIRPYETGDPTVMNLAKIIRVDSIPGSQVVRIDVEGEEWVALVEAARPVFTGQLIELRPDPDRILLFSPVSGVSLLD